MPIIQYLTRKPLLGFTSSLLTISLTHLQVLQAIGAVLGIIIAVITAILKVLELKDKLYNTRELDMAIEKSIKDEKSDADLF